MGKAKKQIRLTEGGLQDRFMVTVSEELGKEIRAVLFTSRSVCAEKENMSLSAWIARAIVEYLERQSEE